MTKKIGIIGLGLMGGSFGLALKGFKSYLRLGYDIDPSVSAQALGLGAVDRIYGSVEETIAQADVSIFCVPPHALVECITKCIAADAFPNGALLSEICGVKVTTSEFIQNILSGYSKKVSYVGIHPMAGKEVGTIAHASRELFQATGFIVTTTQSDSDENVAFLLEMGKYIGASRFAVMNPKDHDALIAYSSDLMHISAAALCYCMPSTLRKVHTAGAFRDCTRVGNIDAALWTDLLTSNRDAILPVLDEYIETLVNMRQSLLDDDHAVLHNTLSLSQKRRKKIDENN
jgi:prephenate dehydrogenase